MDEGRSYTVGGRKIVVFEESGGWRLRCGEREVRHRYLDGALAQLLGGTSSDATRRAAEILRSPEGSSID